MILENQEKQSFDVLYEAYYVPVFRYAYSQLKNKEEAEDIAQWVFVRVFEKNRLEDYTKISKAYFFTIARNRIIDYYKKRKDFNFDPFDAYFNSLFDEKNDIRAEIEKKEKAENLIEAMESLGFYQKEVVSLKFFSDLENSEIARIVDKSEESVRQIQSRSIRKLRNILSIQ